HPDFPKNAGRQVGEVIPTPGGGWAQLRMKLSGLKKDREPVVEAPPRRFIVTRLEDRKPVNLYGIYLRKLPTQYQSDVLYLLGGDLDEGTRVCTAELTDTQVERLKDSCRRWIADIRPDVQFEHTQPQS